MQLTVVQTCLGVFSEYVIRREEDGSFLQDGGTFGTESTARKFADARHAIDMADELMGDTIRPRIRELVDADAEASEREQDPEVDELTSRGRRLFAFRDGLQAILADPSEAEMHGSCASPPIRIRPLNRPGPVGFILRLPWTLLAVARRILHRPGWCCLALGIGLALGAPAMAGGKPSPKPTATKPAPKPAPKPCSQDLQECCDGSDREPTCCHTSAGCKPG